MILMLACSIAVVTTTLEPQLLPREVVLTRSTASQRLLVVAAGNDQKSVGDLTAIAQFTSADASIATVGDDGTVRPVSNGGTQVIARLPDGRQVAARVTVQGTAERPRWSFRNDVRAVMTRAGCNAGRCHGAAGGQNQFKLSLRGFDLEADYRALTREEFGRRTSLVDAAESLILLKATLGVPHAGGKRFTTDSTQYRILHGWIESGARPSREDDPRITEIQIFPAAATLKVGDRHGTVVVGSFTDGTVRDVSPFALLDSSNPSVASVDEQGQIVVHGSGEATITAWHLDQVVAARITIPFDAPIPADVYTTAPRHNFIDELVLRKLKTMRIRPSGRCADAEFLRRAYLDAAGILPTADQAREFLADTSANKRQRLIESLIGSSEFVDLWTYKWSELLLVSSAKLRATGAQAFHEWIRSCVESNLRWDQFVSAIITASGSTVEQGAANYYLLHKDPTAVAENAAQTFLGLSIHCARCHNHPLDKWTQDDYYALSSFFARVGRKDDLAVGYANNERALAETTIYLADQGEVVHPGRGRPVTPRPLESAAINLDPNVDRREVFARWMTSANNQYFVRSVVNRVWKHFMGRGLVEPVDDLRALNPASNEALFQALTEQFVEQGFDMNQLIRTIMNSATYQTSASANGNAHDTEYYSHFAVRKLSAEVAVDVISQAVGVPEEFPGFPTGTRSLQLPDSRIRSYTLNVLGRPAREMNSHHERIHHSTVTQALHMVNSEFISRKLRSAAGTLQQLLDSDAATEDIVREIYWISLARPPKPQQLLRLVTAIEGIADATADTNKRAALRREAFEDFWAGLLMSKEFLCNH